jgi:hypothetical protein
MIVQLTEGDRIVLKYETKGVDVWGNIVTMGEIALVELMDEGLGDFVVVFKTQNHPEWTLQWKSNFDIALKKFIDEVGDFDADFQIDRSKVNTQKDLPA